MVKLTRVLAVVLASLAFEATTIDSFGCARTQGVGGEVAARTNVGHFLVKDPTVDDTGQINHRKVAYGMKSIVELTHVFGPGHTADLRADGRERLSTFVALNRSRLTRDFVESVLVLDEPLLRGMTLLGGRDPGWGGLTGVPGHSHDAE